MSTEGLEKRAEGVAALLAPLRTQQRSSDETGEPAADLTWGATRVLTELLAASRPLQAPLSRAEAEHLLGSSGYTLSQFETKGWLRCVLGRFEVPSGVGVAIAGLEHGRVRQGIAPEELRALAPLRRRIYDHAETKPFVAKERAESIIASYPGTPTLTDLTQQGVLQSIDKGIQLETKASLWSALGGRIAAALWMNGPAANDFIGWTNLVSEEFWWTDAPSRMRPDQRFSLLDAMMHAIESEPDLKDWSQELEHIAADVSDLGARVRRVNPPANTPFGRYSWWKHLRVNAFECRRRLACIVSAVVRHDDSQGPSPFRRIRKLLSLGCEKAWLAFVVPYIVVHSRPKALASLALDKDHAVLAMTLLDSLPIPETSWDPAEISDERRERYRTTIWCEMLPLFVGGLVALGESNEQGAKNCIELLTYLERRSTDGGFLLDPSRRSIHDTAVKARLNAFSNELATATISNRIASERPPYLARALPLLAATLENAVTTEPSASRRLTLLSWIFEHAAVEAHQSLAASLAVKIVSTLAEWLNRDKVGASLDAWFNDEFEVTDLPWQKFLFASVDATSLFVNDVQLHEKSGQLEQILTSLQPEDAKETSSETFSDFQLRATLLRKRRLYLLLLVRVLERLGQLSQVVAQPPSILETRLHDRLYRFLRDDAVEVSSVFSGAPYIPASAELLALTLRIVESLPSLFRKKCIADWILIEDDPFLVLGILGETRSSALRTLAEARFSQIDWDAYLDEQSFWPTMFSLARMAVVADRLELSTAILKKADTPGARDEQAFLPRLMLAAAKKSKADVDAVPEPDKNDPRNADIIQFFRGVAELETQPTNAAKLFEQLVRRRVHVAEAAVNLFSARLRSADNMEDSDQRIATIAAALAEWRETSTYISAEDLQRVGWDVHQNELFALFKLNFHSEFWRRWNALPRSQRAHEAFVRLGVIAAATADDAQTTSLVLAQASEFHGEPTPAWLDALRAAAAESRLQQVALPSVAHLSDDVIRAVYNEGVRRPIRSRAVIFSSVPDADIENFLLDLHLNAARELQRMEAVLGSLSEEDKLSDFMIALLRSACRAMNITIHSQERGGLSGTEHRATDRGGVGERDWTVQADAVEIAVVEALQLPSSATVIQQHLRKLLERYDRAGLPRALMVLYVRENFGGSVAAYQNAVRAWAGSEAPLVGDVEVHEKPAAYLRVLKTTHQHSGGDLTFVFHLILRILRH